MSLPPFQLNHLCLPPLHTFDLLPHNPYSTTIPHGPPLEPTHPRPEAALPGLPSLLFDGCALPAMPPPLLPDARPTEQDSPDPRIRSTGGTDLRPPPPGPNFHQPGWNFLGPGRMGAGAPGPSSDRQPTIEGPRRRATERTDLSSLHRDGRSPASRHLVPRTEPQPSEPRRLRPDHGIPHHGLPLHDRPRRRRRPGHMRPAYLPSHLRPTSETPLGGRRPAKRPRWTNSP